MDYFEHGLGEIALARSLDCTVTKDKGHAERERRLVHGPANPRNGYGWSLRLKLKKRTTNCFQISALGPRALVISADEGFSVLPINAFGVIELFLRSKQR
jgi:hypothetical protein